MSDAELEARRAEVLELARELEETNRGLIALYTELERAKEVEARLAAIVLSSDDAILSMDTSLIIQTWNPGAARLLGYDQDEIVGQSIEVLVPGDEVGEGLAASIARLEAGERALTYDSWRRRKDGSWIEVAVTLSAMRDQAGQLIGYSKVLRDLTERRQAEEALAEAQAAQRLVDDRERIARDLHDLVIQRVFAAGMAAQGAAGLEVHPEAEARMRGVVDELDRAVSEIRSVIFGLQHGRQQGTSVRAQIPEATAQAAGSLGFPPRLRFEGPVDAVVPDTTLEQLLAVVREALSNVARHAGASEVEVVVSAGKDLALEVTDNGRGPQETTRRSGLRNLRERAEALGGTFAVESETGRGTHLEWRIPRPA